MSTVHGSLSLQELKRLQGGELILNGYDNAEIAEIVGVSLSAVKKWRKKLKDNKDDIACLYRKAGSGRPFFLTDEQKQQLRHMILEGAIAHGYPSERWTSKIIADLIQNTFGVTMSPRAVRALLPSLGLSPQKPVVKSHKHSDKAVVEWASRTWMRLKKKRKNSAFP